MVLISSSACSALVSLPVTSIPPGENDIRNEDSRHCCCAGTGAYPSHNKLRSILCRSAAGTGSLVRKGGRTPRSVT
jgi:hypothetical protein